MSVVRGRPPGLAGGMKAASRRYWSSLNAWPDPKAPTSKRSSRVHMAASETGSSQNALTTVAATVKPTGAAFQTGAARRASCGGRNGWAYDRRRRGAAAPFLVVQNPVFKLGPWAAAHLRVVTSPGAIPVRKLICRAAHPLHLQQRRVR
jgi:hypothetical protein